jgi:type IV pilus assembly protein PilM
VYLLRDEGSMLLDTLKSVLQDPPPGMAFEVSEAGIAAARVGTKAELEFQALRPGVLAVSPLKENVVEEDEFGRAVKSLAATQAARKRKGATLILPDFSARITVLDFDHFPADAKEQASLIRFRLKRSVPFDVESAAISYFVQHGATNVDVVVVLAPLDIVARYEAPFRTAGLNPGLVTMSSLAALELAPEAGLSVMAKLAGRVLTLVVREKNIVKLVRCVELPAAELDEVAAVLAPTFVYVEDNLGRRAEKLFLCGFGAGTDEAQRRFGRDLGVEVEPLRSPLGMAGENNAGLLGYLRSVSKNN